MSDGHALPREEVRFAVVLNGGVSLAVWMGGVVLELDRLTRGLGGYEHLLGLAGATARADVISGTSAGGINGAALALAQVNPRADLSNLRELWAEQGRMDLLLRAPFKGSPVSLLKGDEFFLPKLEDAMRRLTVRYEPMPAAERPIDLRITTTLLRGTTKTTVDALGQRLTQNVHQGCFRFERTDDHHDDFAAEEGLPPDLPYQLALAARSSASFPVAFEPSFVDTARVGSKASWWHKDIDRSQFAVDGGVLVNTPTREALEAIDQMPAEGPTRRVMLLVFPHATAAGAEPPAQTKADQPSVLSTVQAIMRAQSSQSNRTFVDEIEQYNRGAAARRGGRNALLESLANNSDQPLPQRLYALVETLHPHYRDIRLRRAARKLAERQVIALAQRHQEERAGSAAWSFERIRDSVELAHREWLERNGSLPYVPKDGPPHGLAELAQDGSSGWPWDVSTGERLAASALDMLKRVVWVMPRDAHLDEIYQARKDVHHARAQLRALREKQHLTWERDAVQSPDKACWTARLKTYDNQMKGHDGDEVRKQVLLIAAAFETGSQVLRSIGDELVKRDPGLAAWKELAALSPGDPDGELDQPGKPYRALSRLLALDVATTCLADDSESPEEQLVELAQVSLQTQNAFARFSIRPDDKAGGYSLSRFSGFLKRSWRANDWIWGRLDAATMLCRVLLDPVRIRRSAGLAGRIPAELGEEEARNLAAKHVGELVGRLFGEMPADARIARCREEAIGELADVYHRKPGSALPATCPNRAELVAWSLHVQIVLEELPELRRAILADSVDGASTRSNSERFIRQYDMMLDDIERLPAGHPPDRSTVDMGLAALEAFDRAGIGREPLGEEAASDQMIRTATTAAATAITVADSDNLGVKAVRPVTRSLRGLVLLPYWMILGLTRGGQLARFLGQFALAAGGLLLVLAVLGALPDWAETPGAAIGGGAVLAAFGYSALRTGSLLHGLVLLSPGVTLVAYGISEVQQKTPGSLATGRGLAGLIGIVLFVAALLLLGSLPGVVLTPMGTVERIRARIPLWWRSRRWVGPAIGFGAAIVVLGLCALVAFTGALTFLNDHEWLVLIGAAVIVVVAGVLSYFGGKSLRTWQVVPGKNGAIAKKPAKPKRKWTDPATQDPAAAAATWAVVYGACYILVAIGLSFVARETPFSGVWWSDAPWWARAAMATSITFAAVLLLVVPWYVPWRARTELRRRLIAEAGPAVYKEPDRADRAAIEARLRMRLVTHGMVCLWLATCPDDKDVFALTKKGGKVADLITKELAKLRLLPQPIGQGGGRDPSSSDRTTPAQEELPVRTSG
jgi:patatin-related protein